MFLMDFIVTFFPSLATVAANLLAGFLDFYSKETGSFLSFQANKLKEFLCNLLSLLVKLEVACFST
jgi:hypothetical protein